MIVSSKPQSRTATVATTDKKETIIIIEGKGGSKIFTGGGGGSMVLDALSCYLSFILKHSDTKWDTKT